MSTIKCRSCFSSMVIDRCESSGYAITCWHQCPVCKQVRLTSEQQSLNGQNANNLQADEDVAQVNDHEFSYTL